MPSLCPHWNTPFGNTRLCPFDRNINRNSNQFLVVMTILQNLQLVNIDGDMLCFGIGIVAYTVTSTVLGFFPGSDEGL